MIAHELVLQGDRGGGGEGIFCFVASESSSKPRRPPSPQVPLTTKMRLTTVRLYLDCDSHKLLLDRKGTNFFEHVSWIVIVVAMAAFIGFMVWLVIYMGAREYALSKLEESPRARGDQSPR